MEEPNRLWPNHLNIDVVFFWFETKFQNLKYLIEVKFVLRLPKKEKQSATKMDRKEVQQIIIF